MLQMELWVTIFDILDMLPSADLVKVQGEAQGSNDQLEEFVQHLNKGPSAASVSGVEYNDISSKSGESGFNVRRSDGL